MVQWSGSRYRRVFFRCVLSFVFLVLFCLTAEPFLTKRRIYLRTVLVIVILICFSSSVISRSCIHEHAFVRVCVYCFLLFEALLEDTRVKWVASWESNVLNQMKSTCQVAVFFPCVGNHVRAIVWKLRLAIRLILLVINDVWKHGSELCIVIFVEVF